MGVRSPADAPSAAWSVPPDQLLTTLGSGPSGLASEEARRRLASDGPNVLEGRVRHSGVELLVRQFADPIVLLLVGAAILSLGLGDLVDTAIILSIVLLSGLLGFVQAHRTGRAVDQLTQLVRLHADVRRDGRVVEVPLETLVVGDLVELRAGDVVPCDCRVIAATALQVDDSALTGEAYPRHKRASAEPAGDPVLRRPDAVLLGSHVVSGQGTAVAVAVGARTELGRLAHELRRRPRRSAFEEGVTRFGLLLARVTLVLAMVLLAMNVLLGRPVLEAMLFSLALAVGLTPQLLPAIVSVSLATGAHRMAARRVIVRRLDAIEDFGSMDVLCTDRTGTLTEGQVRLDAALDTLGQPDDRVAALARRNASAQTGFANPIDEAILAAVPGGDDGSPALGEVPFDFTRKRLSVLVDHDGVRQIIAKGAVAAVLDVCTQVQRAHGPVPIGPVRAELDRRFAELSAEGLRVLAVATRPLPGRRDISASDEHDLVLRGLLTFADPPKSGVREAVGRIRDAGIRLVMLTGDNRFAAAHVASAVGIETTRVVTGAELGRLDDEALAALVGQVGVFAELDPLHKGRVLTAFRTNGATVGYLGDGINDAGALDAADVGISVDTAVDVAKQAAAIVLLDKDLDVLAEGVALGRQTFANTLKYVFTTVSANFGNVASMAAASAFLPFLPLLPRQILLLNFLSDVPSMTIAADRVDAEQRDRPQHWDMRFVRDGMVTFGLISSGFDLLTFAILLQGFGAGATLFRTGWFVGSTLTELAVLFVLRTRRPAWQSHPGRALVLSSAAVAIATLTIPFVPALARPLGLQAIPGSVLAAIGMVVLGYLVTTELVKPRFYRAMAITAQRSPAPGRPGRGRRRSAPR